MSDVNIYEDLAKESGDTVSRQMPNSVIRQFTVLVKYV